MHLNGDQHFTTLIHYGTKNQRDSNWSFCTPAITVGYQRWWLPDEINKPYENRPAHGLPNTGEYLDGFENKIYVYAIGNPSGSDNPNRYKQADIRSSGFSIVRIDTQDRTYTCESYRFLAVLSNGSQKEDFFPGFPHTIRQFENYGRKPAGYLDSYKSHYENAVIKVFSEKSGELVYAVRTQGREFQPWVFEEDSYTVKIGIRTGTDGRRSQSRKF